MTPQDEKENTVPKERVHHGKIYVLTEVVDDPNTENPPNYTEWDEYKGGPLKDGQRLEEEPSIEINWNKLDDGGWLQLSMYLPREKWIEIADELKAAPEIIGKAMYTGQWSRYDANRTIRVLRKARDQALGADE